MSLPWNRLHVFANHFVVPGLPIADVGGDEEHVTGEAEREQSFVLEGDIHAKRPVLNGMADVIHNLAVDAGITLPGMRFCGCRLADALGFIIG